MIERAVELAQAGRRVIWAERVDQHRVRVAEARRIDRTLAARMRGRTAALRHTSGGQIDFISSDPTALRGRAADAVFAFDVARTAIERVDQMAQTVVATSPFAETHVAVSHLAAAQPSPSTLEGETP